MADMVTRKETCMTPIKDTPMEGYPGQEDVNDLFPAPEEVKPSEADSYNVDVHHVRTTPIQFS